MNDYRTPCLVSSLLPSGTSSLATLSTSVPFSTTLMVMEKKVKIKLVMIMMMVTMMKVKIISKVSNSSTMASMMEKKAYLRRNSSQRLNQTFWKLHRPSTHPSPNSPPHHPTTLTSRLDSSTSQHLPPTI